LANNFSTSINHGCYRFFLPPHACNAKEHFPDGYDRRQDISMRVEKYQIEGWISS
jgi:hypothetical protein